MLNEFNRFKSEFKGDPEEAVKKLVASGKISQKQLNDLQTAAQTFKGLFNL
jgi:hypothetical protein